MVCRRYTQSILFIYAAAVLVDKPVAAHYQQVLELGALAKSKNLVLYPFQNRRWDSDFLALRKLLDLPASDPKSLGTLYEFESRYAYLVSILFALRNALTGTIAASTGSAWT